MTSKEWAATNCQVAWPWLRVNTFSYNLCIALPQTAPSYGHQDSLSVELCVWAAYSLLDTAHGPNGLQGHRGSPANDGMAWRYHRLTESLISRRKIFLEERYF